MKRLALSLIFLFSALVAFAQQDNENEFQRIAQRIMDSHETGSVFLSDSIIAQLGAWHGGYYLGATSNGRTLPSASLTYKSGKLTFSGNLALDIAEKTHGKTDETLMDDGSGRTVWTDIHTNSKTVDGNIQLDYNPSSSDVFSVNLIEKFNRQIRNEEANAEYFDVKQVPYQSSIKQQRNHSNELSAGMQAQWKHTFVDRSLLLARANFKHNNRSIDVDYTDWSREGVPTLDAAGLTLNGNSPFGELQYTSRQWWGLSFVLGAKNIYEKVEIDSNDADFSFNTTNNILNFGLKYGSHWLKLSAMMSYNDFSQKIDAQRKNYHDMLSAISADWPITARHRLSLTFDRNIIRPSYLRLYPYRYLESSLGTYYVGNPDLEPAQTRQLKAVYSYDNQTTFKVSFTAGYERIQDDITQVTAEDKELGSSYKTWVNDALYNNVNMAIDGQWQWGILDLRWHIRPRYTNYKAQHNADYGNWSWNFKLRPELTFPAGWKAACALYYQGAEHKLTTYKDSYTYFSLRAVKDFGNWSLYAFYQDIFEQDRVETVHGAKSQVTTRTDRNDGAVIVGFSYTF